MCKYLSALALTLSQSPDCKEDPQCARDILKKISLKLVLDVLVLVSVGNVLCLIKDDYVWEWILGTGIFGNENGNSAKDGFGSNGYLCLRIGCVGMAIYDQGPLNEPETSCIGNHCSEKEMGFVSGIDPQRLQELHC